MELRGSDNNKHGVDEGGCDNVPLKKEDLELLATHTPPQYISDGTALFCLFRPYR